MKSHNIRLLPILTVAIIILTAGLLTSCFDENDNSGAASKETSRVTYSKAEESHPEKCRLIFSYDGEELENVELEYGTQVNYVPFNVEENEEATFNFLGWDKDGDGVAEEFPLTVTEDTQLDAIVEKVYKTYHYTIINKGETVRSIDCHYGDNIDYPVIKSEIIGETVNFWLGWKVNGVFDGTYPVNCVENLEIEAYYAESQIVKIYAGGSLYADYVEAGTIIDIAAHDITPSSGHKYVWYYDSSYTEPVTSFVMIKGNLSLYGREEPETLIGEEVHSADDIVRIFNIMQLNRETSRKLIIDYNYGDIDSILDYINSHAESLYNYKIGATLDISQLTLTVEYEKIGGKTSSTREYTFVPSANITKPSSKRSSSYNSFASDKRTNSLTVKTSDALAYALENGYRPDITDSSVRALYNKMKDFLREYVTDSMTDTEKAKAIYEGLIETVTYDNAVLEKVKNKNPGIAEYNCFYLEGVFNDKLAVCDGIAKAYSSLCNMEGIECVRVTGKTVEGDISHAWNKVKLNGKWYVVDATAGGCITGSNQVLTYVWFLLSDSEYSSHAISDGKRHSDIVCNTTYDKYSSMTYAGKSLKVTSVTDGAEIIRAFNDSIAAGKSATLDMSLAISGKTSAQALNAILEEINADIRISYVENQKSITLQITK